MAGMTEKMKVVFYFIQLEFKWPSVTSGYHIGWHRALFKCYILILIPQARPRFSAMELRYHLHHHRAMSNDEFDNSNSGLYFPTDHPIEPRSPAGWAHHLTRNRVVKSGSSQSVQDPCTELY